MKRWLSWKKKLNFLDLKLFPLSFSLYLFPSLSLPRFKVRTFKLLSKNVGREWRRREGKKKEGKEKEQRIELGFDFWFDSSIKRVKESEVLFESFEG